MKSDRSEREKNKRKQAEKKNYKDEVLDEEFLLGKDLLVTPVLEQGKIHIRPYFPGKKTNWFDLNSGRKYKGGKKHYITNTLNETAPVFIRGGSSIYRQNVEKVTRTDELTNVFYLSLALNEDFRGFGEILACADYSNSNKNEKDSYEQNRKC